MEDIIFYRHERLKDFDFRHFELEFVWCNLSEEDVDSIKKDRCVLVNTYNYNSKDKSIGTIDYYKANKEEEPLLVERVNVAFCKSEKCENYSQWSLCSVKEKEESDYVLLEDYWQ